MKWPWVSRLALENALEVCRLRAAELDRERDRYDHLVAEMREMQRQGYTAKPPEPPAPVIEKMHPEIKYALQGRFPGNSPHKAMVLNQIEEWQLAGREPEWIARRIWDGEETVDG